MQESETFFVYENWQAEGYKARVHRGRCPSCNYGKGIHPEASEEHGRWHGPFDTLNDALVLANRSGRVVSLCKRCTPQ